MERNKQCCGNCYFNDKDPETGDGICLRYPPTSRKTERDMVYTPDVSVGAECWCGEWKQEEVKPVESPKKKGK